MRVISYSRVSSQEQAREGVSIEAQPARIAAFCQLYEHNVVATIADAGFSGKNLKRPGIQRAIAMLANDEADGICVVALSRLTRSIRDWQYFVDNFFGERAKTRKQVYSVNESISTETAAGRLFVNMLLAMSQFEREQVGERTRDAQQYKIANNESTGRVRFGYDVGADGKTLVPNANEQHAIELMQEWRGDGMALRSIADELKRLGIRGKNQKPLGPTTIRCILNRVSKRDSAA